MRLDVDRARSRSCDHWLARAAVDSADIVDSTARRVEARSRSWASRWYARCPRATCATDSVMNGHPSSRGTSGRRCLPDRRSTLVYRAIRPGRPAVHRSTRPGRPAVHRATRPGRPAVYRATRPGRRARGDLLIELLSAPPEKERKSPARSRRAGVGPVTGGEKAGELSRRTRHDGCRAQVTGRATRHRQHVISPPSIWLPRHADRARGDLAAGRGDRGGGS